MIGNISNEIKDVCSAKSIDDFDNPLVLSFLSNFCLSSAYLPSRFFTKWCLSRLSLSSTGQLELVGAPESSLLLGEFLIIRVIGMNILFAVDDWKEEKGEQVDERTVNNLKLLGSILCHAFVRLVNGKELSKGIKREGKWKKWVLPLESEFDVDTADTIEISYGLIDEPEGEGEEEAAGEEEEEEDLGEYSPISGLVPEDEIQTDIQLVQDKLSEGLEALTELCTAQKKQEASKEEKKTRADIR